MVSSSEGSKLNELYGSISRDKKCLIVVPARLESSRLPNKVMFELAGESILYNIYKALNSTCSQHDILFAVDSQEVADHVTGFGAAAILTDPNLPCGSDRVAQAYQKLINGGNVIAQPGNSIKNVNEYTLILNFQGDAVNTNPEIANQLIQEFLRAIEKDGCLNTVDEVPEIITPLVRIHKKERDNKACVKAVFEDAETNIKACDAITDKTKIIKDFSREYNAQPNQQMYQHIGLYAFTPKSLAKFASLKQTSREQHEGLEQLRALENGMKIGGVVIKCNAYIKPNAPLEINTPEDYKLLQESFNATKKPAC